MTRKGCSIPVRFGSTLAHAPNLEAAAALMRRLQLEVLRGSLQQLGPQVDLVHDSLLTAASRAAGEALSLLVTSTGLNGRATKNFGTALRAAPVRELLQDVHTAHGLLLLDELGEELLEAGRHDAPVPREVQVEPLGNLVHVQTEIEVQEIAVFVNPAGPIL